MNGNSRLSPEPVLLGYLYKEPHHGYELHKRMRDEFGNIWHSSQSQTYNILTRLNEQGFLCATEVEQEKLPSRQVLQISQTGKERFEAWLYAPTKCSVHAIRVEFITKLFFMQQYYPEKVGGMILTQLEIVDAGIQQLETRQDDHLNTGSTNRLALDLRIKLLHSVRDWLADRLSAPTGIDRTGKENGKDK